MKFRKKPVVIEAIKFDGLNFTAVMAFIGNDMESMQENTETNKHRFLIKTLEGTMAANEGDWIIRGVKGEHYPCKPDIFEATYEAV